MPEAAHYIPPLTTVRQDFDAVARESLAVLLDRLDGDASPAHREVIPELVVRASVRGPARRGGTANRSRRNDTYPRFVDWLLDVSFARNRAEAPPPRRRPVTESTWGVDLNAADTLLER